MTRDWRSRDRYGQWPDDGAEVERPTRSVGKRTLVEVEMARMRRIRRPETVQRKPVAPSAAAPPAAESPVQQVAAAGLAGEISKTSTWIAYPAGELGALQKRLNKAQKDIPSAVVMEQYLWVSWIDNLGMTMEGTDEYRFADTSVLDIDEIEDHLEKIGVLGGTGSVLGVDFGGWTSTEDERNAVRAANAKWPEMHAEMAKFLETKA